MVTHVQLDPTEQISSLHERTVRRLQARRIEKLVTELAQILVQRDQFTDEVYEALTVILEQR